MEPLGIKISPELWTKIENQLHAKELPEYLQTELQPWFTKQLSPSRKLPLAAFVRYGKWNKTGLGDLTEMVSLHLPSPEKPPANPELQKRLKKLRAQQQNYEYRNMVSNVSTKIREGKPSSKAPIISGLNFALTAASAVFITVYILQSFISDLALRIAIGVAVATALLAIEIFLALRAIEKDEETKQNIIKKTQLKMQ